MDRAEITRAVRRRRALEAIEDERGRERQLADHLEGVIAEADAPELDRALYAQMDPADVAHVREILDGVSADLVDEEDKVDWELEDEPSLEDEIARLQDELARTRARIQALERYVEALADQRPSSD